MIVLTSTKNGDRVAIDPTGVIAVFEGDGRVIIHCRVSSAVQSDAGIVFYHVSETFDEVIQLIDNHHEDRRYRAEQRMRMI